MRFVMLACTLFGVAFAASKLHGSPKVIMSSKLQGTREGRIVQQRLAGYVGKRTDFSVYHQGEGGGLPVRYIYSGKIEQVIVPDVAAYIRTGNQGKARFKVKFSDVQPQAPQNPNIPLPVVADSTRVDIFWGSGDPPYAVGFVVYPSLAGNELLGGKYQVRLLAEYKDASGETFWEVLVELEDLPQFPFRREIEKPFVVLLNQEQDFMKVIAAVE